MSAQAKNDHSSEEPSGCSSVSVELNELAHFYILLLSSVFLAFLHSFRLDLSGPECMK